MEFDGELVCGTYSYEIESATNAPESAFTVDKDTLRFTIDTDMVSVGEATVSVNAKTTYIDEHVATIKLSFYSCETQTVTI